MDHHVSFPITKNELSKCMCTIFMLDDGVKVNHSHSSVKFQETASSRKRDREDAQAKAEESEESPSSAFRSAYYEARRQKIRRRMLAVAGHVCNCKSSAHHRTKHEKCDCDAPLCICKDLSHEFTSLD
ncbi:hypothetical protein GUITHDRAFT_153628 [Guillardia theta CCMP2712]|uniref:Uncharacterized protein n=1 Tax=Guillardia theta (strain CCMP2712) TaxID=905079 RepID=L1J111_GUITC|nr:hypothetical protein GUITHDRAFT_153628 [Guillardia theta CCMP2712]EKX42211.1 hypothetical protein GUITHDRAFT_153628 [Guillardia theta CCMP2712]|eukprot:XP_005829191.1 hypothetical protein GUITHDRAFT_153628 [Guillardia theta CCMP2712]